MSVKPVYEFEYVTTSTDAVPADLQGSTYWYDTGTTENAESVFYGVGDVYAYWYDGADWIVTIVADVGGTPTNLFKAKSYPSIISMVGSGEGGDYEATDYTYSGDTIIHEWVNGDLHEIKQAGQGYTVDNSVYATIDGGVYELPPKTAADWENADDQPFLTGSAPSPTLEYDISESLIGQGAWTGTITISPDTISDSWYRAETTAFESFRAFVGATEGRDCFRGFLPVQGDSFDDKLTNVWQMSSGGSSEFEMDRLYGADANWCSLRSDAHIESTWSDREDAMKFSGAVLAWLKSTNNLNEVGNVSWCTLAEIAEEPEIYRTDGKKNRDRLWRQTINLELVYKTGSNYN